MRGSVYVAGLAAVAALALTACSSSGGSGSSGGGTTSAAASTAAGTGAKSPTGTPYTVCADESLSGVYAAYDVPELTGLKTTIAEVNAAGGLLGHPVELSYLDDQSDVTRAPQVVQQLISQNKCVAMFANSSSTITGAILPFTSAAKVITFSAVVTAALGDPKTYPYHFMTGPETSKQIPAFIAAIKQAGGTKVGILHSNDTGNSALATALQQALPGAGLSFADSESADPTATDLSVQVSKLKAAGADIVYIQSAGPATAVAVKAIAGIGWAPKVLASGAAANSTNQSSVPASLSSTYYALAAAVYAQASTPSAVQAAFTTAVKAAGPITDINQSVSARDALMMIFWAVTKANSVDSTAVAKALEGIGSATLPAGTLLSMPNPNYSATDHSMNAADFSSYWAVLRPGTPDANGQYSGTVLKVNY